jgi:2-succinyl-5-enolpyruvyl-6-hydroxy-3-cyclohexene-1-carboxylate synthase
VGATWPHDRLVFGASRLIRDADRAVPGRRIPVHANRGLAGIDGTVATRSASRSRVSRPSGESQADAAADSAACRPRRRDPRPHRRPHAAARRRLAAARTGEARPRLQLIVGNDGGGTIFDALEVAGSASPDAFDRVQFTPQQVDLAALAAAYGWGYARATTRGELDEALTGRIDGPQLVEVPLPR